MTADSGSACRVEVFSASILLYGNSDMNPGRHFTYSQCGRPRRLRRSRPANWWTVPLFGRCETPSTHPSSECTGAQGIERDGNPGHAGCATLLATRHKGDTHCHCFDACRRQGRFLMRDVLSGTHRAAPMPPLLVGRVGWCFIVKRGKAQPIEFSALDSRLKNA